MKISIEPGSAADAGGWTVPRTVAPDSSPSSVAVTMSAVRTSGPDWQVAVLWVAAKAGRPSRSRPADPDASRTTGGGGVTDADGPGAGSDALGDGAAVESLDDGAVEGCPLAVVPPHAAIAADESTRQPSRPTERSVFMWARRSGPGVVTYEPVVVTSSPAGPASPVARAASRSWTRKNSPIRFICFR